MSPLSITEFADKVTEVMPVVMRQFTKHQTDKFYRMKISLPQFVILELLNRLGESRMTDMAHSLNVTTAAMTGIVNRLVRDGYVARGSDPNDRRIIKVNLTAKGVKVVKDIIEHRRRTTIDIFSKISEAEREEYLKILMHIHDELMKEKEA